MSWVFLRFLFSIFTLSSKLKHLQTDIILHQFGGIPFLIRFQISYQKLNDRLSYLHLVQEINKEF